MIYCNINVIRISSQCSVTVEDMTVASDGRGTYLLCMYASVNNLIVHTTY